MKEILLISNITQQSNDDLVYASAFCTFYKCRLHIIHIEQGLDPILFSANQTYAKLGFKMESFERRKDLLHIIRDHTQSYSDPDWLNATINKESESWLLNKFLNDKLLDLIIIGQHLFTHQFDKIAENIKNVLVNSTKVPILSIPKSEVFQSFTKVHYLINALTSDKISNLEDFKELFPDVSPTLIHIKNDRSKPISMPEVRRWLLFVNELFSDDIGFETEQITYEQFFTEQKKIPQVHHLWAFSCYNKNFWKSLADPTTGIRLLSSLTLPTLIFKHHI